MPGMQLTNSTSESGTPRRRAEFSKLPFDSGELRLRERLHAGSLADQPCLVGDDSLLGNQSDAIRFLGQGYARVLSGQEAAHAGGGAVLVPRHSDFDRLNLGSK